MLRPRRAAELPAAPLVDEAVFEIDPDLRVGALEEPLDLAEERFVQVWPAWPW